MKRVGRSNSESRLTTFDRENSRNLSQSSASLKASLSDTSDVLGCKLYDTLETIFDILVPLRSEFPIATDRRVSGGDSSDPQKPLKTTNLCSSCGKLAASCECSGGGDFEESNVRESTVSLECETADELKLDSKAQSKASIQEISDLYEYVIHSEKVPSYKETDSADSGSELGEIYELSDRVDSLSKHNLLVESDDEVLVQSGSNKEAVMGDNTQDAEGVKEGKEGNEEAPEGETPAPEEGAPPEDEAAEGAPPADGAAEGEPPEGALPEGEAAEGEAAEGEAAEGEAAEGGAAEGGAAEGGAAEGGAAEGGDAEGGAAEEDAEGLKEKEEGPDGLPLTDEAVLAELQEADDQAVKTAILINQMKESIAEFQEKELSDEDTLILKTKQAELMAKLAEFEEITQRVQQLVGLTDSMPLVKDTESEGEKECECTLEDAERFKKAESLIPKVIVCGPDNIVPRIIVCEPPSKQMVFTCGDCEILEEPPVSLCHCLGECQCPGPQQESCEQGCDDGCHCPPCELPGGCICTMKEASSGCHTSGNEKPSGCHCPPGKEMQFGGSHCPSPKEMPNLMMSLTGRLSESYTMQERLATDNAELECGRYYLQEELLQKDTTVDVLQKRVGSLQSEMRIIAKQNTILTEKLAQISQMDCNCCAKKNLLKGSTKQGCTCSDPAGKLEGTCAKKPMTAASKPMGQACGCSEPAGTNPSKLERQLHLIEDEVKGMQCELVQVQRERQQLEQQRKLLKCTGPVVPPSCPPCCVRNQGGRESSDQALRDLKEQYARLQEDYKGKVTEVAGLRRDVDKLRCQCEKAQEGQLAAEAQCRCVQGQLKSAEMETKKLLGSREFAIEQEQQLSVAKQRFREAQDELEELRALVQDQTSQLEDYRNKYLQAQQQVEEQRRQIDVMEMDNGRITDQVNLEIQRVKSQFQEKLQELTPLPDILKATQLKLQEAQQMRMMSERNFDELQRELQDTKDKAMQSVRELEEHKSNLHLTPDERETMQEKFSVVEKKCNELKEENAAAKAELARSEEIAAQSQRRLEEKMHETAQLSAQLETVREESARQVARTKDRSETVRRSLQCQISELERQLAQSRAAARAAQKDRDEIRQRMQCQINNLNESFDQAQMRIRSLQSHVSFLKTSYTNIFENGNIMLTECPAAANYSPDCDCNF